MFSVTTAYKLYFMDKDKTNEYLFDHSSIKCREYIYMYV